MICSRCRSNPATIRIPYAKLWLCTDCFKEFFISRVEKVVEEFKMFDPGTDSVMVAISGGKDSAALLHAIVSAYPGAKISAAHVNMGIVGYSDRAEDFAERLAGLVGVELHVYDVRSEEGITVDAFEETSYRRRVCAPCSSIRRRALDKLAIDLGADVILTGHNLDDMLAVMVKAQLNGEFKQLARLRPIQRPPVDGYPAKAKPLIKLSEREIVEYSRINGLPTIPMGCPHAEGNRQRRVKSMLNWLEERQPGFKLRLISSYLRLIEMLPEDGGPPLRCKLCGLPSENEICSSCARIALAKDVMSRLSITARRPGRIDGYHVYEPTRISTVLHDLYRQL